GGLFLGLSFFLIAAALLLMALIFQFGVESRTRQTGVPLALGFTPRNVRGLLWGEGLAAAALGAPLGGLGGMVYARLLMLAEAPAGESAAAPALSKLGLRAARRRPGRSLATVALLASGAFLVSAVGVNELDAAAGAQNRASGTGGFALFGRSTIPIFDDL